jgi:hypothetical protein
MLLLCVWDEDMVQCEESWEQRGGKAQMYCGHGQREQTLILLHIKIPDSSCNQQSQEYPCIASSCAADGVLLQQQCMTTLHTAVPLDLVTKRLFLILGEFHVAFEGGRGFPACAS